MESVRASQTASLSAPCEKCQISRSLSIIDGVPLVILNTDGETVGSVTFPSGSNPVGAVVNIGTIDPSTAQNNGSIISGSIISINLTDANGAEIQPLGNVQLCLQTDQKGPSSVSGLFPDVKKDSFGIGHLFGIPRREGRLGLRRPMPEVIERVILWRDFALYQLCPPSQWRGQRRTEGPLQFIVKPRLHASFHQLELCGRRHLRGSLGCHPN